VTLVGTRLFVALDARAATAAAVTHGLGGPRLRGFASVPLAAGAIVPSPSTPSLARPEEVRDAVRRAVDGVEHPGGRATLVLPDGIARLSLVTLPADADAREFVRFRLAPSLPWMAADSLVEALPVARGRVIAAALRRAAVAEHEQALAAAGLEVERVNLAPLLAAGALRGSRPDAVHVVLGDVAVCLLAVHGGSVAALRNRRRDPSAGEAARLAEEAFRTAQLAANGSGPRPALPVFFSGADAARLRRELDPSDLADAPGKGELPPEAAEAAWLAGALR
jgi:hypothetical protein